MFCYTTDEDLWIKMFCILFNDFAVIWSNRRLAKLATLIITTQQ